MYSGVNPDDFPTAQGEPEEPTVVFVGRIDPLEDLHTLIRAFAIVRERIPDARLRMFGPVTPANERHSASCPQLITEPGLSGAATLKDGSNVKLTRIRLAIWSLLPACQKDSRSR